MIYPEFLGKIHSFKGTSVALTSGLAYKNSSSLEDSVNPYFLFVRYLVQFLSHLSEYQAVNKMTPSNIAIVLGPNLLWPRCEGSVYPQGSSNAKYDLDYSTTLLNLVLFLF